MDKTGEVWILLFSEVTLFENKQSLNNFVTDCSWACFGALPLF